MVVRLTNMIEFYEVVSAAVRSPRNKRILDEFSDVYLIVLIGIRLLGWFQNHRLCKTVL